jgi:hypothetical protein
MNIKGQEVAVGVLLGIILVWAIWWSSEVASILKQTRDSPREIEGNLIPPRDVEE